MKNACACEEVARPDVADIHSLLRTWGGIVAHFSGIPKGVPSNSNQPYPQDLLAVIAGDAQGGLCCSVVRPTDVFDGPRTHAWGCVGVIVRPRSPHSLVGTSPGDLGSRCDADGDRHCEPANRDVELEEVRESLFGRLGLVANEWVVRDYDVLGVLAQPPYGVENFGQHTTLSEIVETFSPAPIFQFQGGVLMQLSPVLSRVKVDDLYP